MLKKINFSLISLSLIGILFSGCNDESKTTEHYVVVEVNPVSNYVVIDYETKYISPDYFKSEVDKYCSDMNKVASVNFSKKINRYVERVSYSCIIK